MHVIYKSTYICQLGMLAYTCDSRILGIQGQPQLHNKFEVSLGYMRPCLEKSTKYTHKYGKFSNIFNNSIKQIKCKIL